MTKLNSQKNNAHNSFLGRVLFCKNMRKGTRSHHKSHHKQLSIFILNLKNGKLADKQKSETLFN